jgi:hypothetical protein
MADYYPLLAKAVAGLDPNTPDARQGIYDRARSALSRQLAAMDPPVDKAILDRELRALEAVFARIEADQSMRMPSGPASEPSARDEVPLALPAKPRPQIAAKTAKSGKNRKPLIAVGLALGAMVVMAIAALALLRRDEPPVLASRPVPAVQPTAPGNPAQSKPGDRVTAGVEPLLSAAPPVSPSPVPVSPVPASPAPVPSAPSSPVASSPVASSPVANSPAASAPAVRSPQSPPPVTTAPAPPVTPGVAVANRMLLLLQGTEQGQEVVVKQGTAVWRTEMVSGGQGQPLEQAIKAGIDVAEMNFRSDITIQRNRDPAFPASHTIQIAFSSIGKSELGPIQAVNQIEFRQVENQTGYALAGQGIAVVENLFLVALAQVEPARSRNEETMKARPFIYVEFQTSAGRRGAMLLEKGVSGQQAFDDAFRNWQ